MFGFINTLHRWVITLLMAGTLAVIGGGVYYALNTTQTIFELLGENRHLREAVTNLTHESKIGYAKVLEQGEREGRLFTRLLFVVTDPEDPARRVLEREYEIEGDVAFFDALIVKFSPQAVMDGKEHALHLWRRIYGEKMKPEDGYPIEVNGEEPQRYRELFKELSARDRQTFWSEIWALSDNPDRLADAGAQALYGGAVYKRLRPGVLLVIKLDANGAFYVETVPDL